MKHDYCLFLQWAHPRMKMRGARFRKVHKQACKRMKRRIKSLDSQNFEAYKQWLIIQDSERKKLDDMCRISMSSFYGDWAVFDYLKDNLLSRRVQRATSELQATIYDQMNSVLRSNGLLVLGCHEKLSDGLEGFSAKADTLNIYEMTSNKND